MNTTAVGSYANAKRVRILQHWAFKTAASNEGCL